MRSEAMTGRTLSRSPGSPPERPSRGASSSEPEAAQDRLGAHTSHATEAEAAPISHPEGAASDPVKDLRAALRIAIHALKSARKGTLVVARAQEAIDACERAIKMSGGRP